MGRRVRRIDLFGRREGCEVVIEIEHFGIETRLRWGYGALRAQGAHPVRVYGCAGQFSQPVGKDGPKIVDGSPRADA
ncbi:Uncharacterised protein [Mycobacteroides abscessus subsp. abscessus]|nr:Uncharacterised protein [Mycobacteroides abscessus subsp. abscessus]